MHRYYNAARHDVLRTGPNGNKRVFTLRVELDDRDEIALILRDIADRLETREHMGQFQTVFDRDRADVGRFAHKERSYFANGHPYA